MSYPTASAAARSHDALKEIAAPGLRDQMKALMGDVGVVTASVQALAERICGAVPPIESAEEGSSGPPQGLADELRRDIDTMNLWVRRAMHAVSRIEGAL